MYKIPGIPNQYSCSNEIADFVELGCVLKKTISMREVIAAINRIAENDYSGGVVEEEQVDVKVESAFSELEDRINYTNKNYPFSIDVTGNVLAIENGTEGTPNYWLYVYLLLATRLNMQKNRIFSSIDGSLLFEELSAQIAVNYLGDRAESIVFGTAAGQEKFEEKINGLCKFLNEGNCFKNRDTNPPTAKDRKLDVVVMKHFTDKKPGKIIGFGQCKTGTNWKDYLTQLRPDSFCTKWLDDSPTVLPVRLFFLCEALSRSTWHSSSSDAGILFDRCRLMDYSNSIEQDLLEKIQNWTMGALEFVDQQS